METVVLEPMTQPDLTTQNRPVEQLEWAIVAGNPADPLLVLLHGAGASAEIWEDHLSALSDDYRVVAVDLPGHRKHPHDKFSFDEAVQSVREVIASEGQPAVLVGHSVGGYVAGKFVEEYSSHVDAIVTSGSYMDWRHGRGLVLSGLYAYVFGPLIKLGRHSDSWRDIIVDRLTLDEYESDTVSENTLTGGVEAMQASAFEDVWTGIGQYNGPVLVGAGREEPFTDDYAPAIAERVGATFEYMPFDSHNGPLTHPEAFVSVVDRFLRDNDIVSNGEPID